MALLQILIALGVLMSGSWCQENAGTNLSPSLEECYNNTLYLTRDYRPPSSIQVLIDIIRKVEDGNPNKDARELAIQLLHRFRQDGIKRTRKEVDRTLGIPYSPKSFEAFKNRVQLYKLTPGNAINFNNNSITPLEACSLHFMLSSTIETESRGDEGSTCGRVAHYTSRIRRRRQSEFAEVDSSSASSCPIESGVIYTKWGAVKAGLLIAGLAAGLQPNPIRVENGTVQSVYASTIGGELSEVALYQAHRDKVVGNNGGWNSTVNPKYYFLERNDNLQLTDAEIRGGLDGLFLGLNIQDWKSKSNNIKLSEILDLYYGRGVYNVSARACNRKTLLRDIVENDVLIQQTLLFNYLLDVGAAYGYTLNKAQMPTMARNAVESFRTYLSSNLNDLECAAENDVIERVSTDILIFIDTAWSYQTIQPVVSHILHNIDVNKYGSSFTIFDGVNCDTIVNKSNSILDFYEQYNITEHQKYPNGFNYGKVFETAHGVFVRKLNNQTDLTGQSTIVLLLPHNTPDANQNSNVQSLRNNYKSILPDIRIIVGGNGAKTSYNDLVTNPNSDIITISDNLDDQAVKNAGNSILDRLQKLPRNVINPECGSSFSSKDTKTFELIQYVEPAGINYHRISPNYFSGGQSLKIQGQSSGRLSVCTSRTDPNVRANMTGADCHDIVSDELTIDISDYCGDNSVADCAPIYISVEGISSQGRCTENGCQFSDSIKYKIRLENVHCSGGVQWLLSKIALVSLLFIVMRF